MHVRILLFAAHREMIGRNRVDLDVPDDSTPEGVYHLLVHDHPALESLRRYTTFAVNREIVSSDVPLQGGDEIALLQPVSGGSHD